MKRITIILSSAALLLGALLPLQTIAQVRGKALYDLMTNERLVKFEGVRSVNWLPDGRGYYLMEGAEGAKSFVRVNPKNQKKSPLFAGTDVSAIIQQYAGITSEENTALPFERFEYVLKNAAIKFSANDRDFLYRFKDKKLRELVHPKIEPQPNSQDLMRNMRGSQLWNGTYSPDFNYFAYVKEYDLYVADTKSGEEKRLTFGGNENIFHGRPDWVYPEEFDQQTAYWWSPQGDKIAYYEFNETAVHKYPLVHDLQAEARLELQSYPNPGEDNPTVKIFIADIHTGEQVELQTNSSGNVYLVRPTWLRDGSELTFQRLNRRQNHLELLAANAKTGALRTILEETEEAFVNLQDDYYLMEDGKHFLWSSERSGWRHLYLYDLHGNLVRQLTSGEWPVSEVTAVDEKGKWIYFTGNAELGLETHFYRVDFEGQRLQKLTTAPGSHRISMDPACQYYTDFYSSFDTPPTLNLHEADGQKLSTLASSNTARLDSLDLEKPELVIVKAADGTTDLHGLLFKPAGFDPAKAYPLVVPVYGGPHSKAVSNSYQMDSRRQALAQLGYMVWVQDNRGLRNRGKKFETETYLKLGQVDLADQAAGVKQISARPYIDGSRVGIYGTSYGGYMTCMAMLRQPEVFQVGIAGAPVTDWRDYDTIYTERYMRTPQENPEGYDLGSALPYAKDLKGHLLIWHGSVDNNVHPGNTIQLINELIKNNKQFELMLYPEERHGVRGEGRDHLQELQLNFFRKHLQKEAFAPSM